jgi:hypothetical protein
VFSKIVVVYQEGALYNVVYSGDLRAAIEREAAWYRKQFDAFREMYKARDFRLVLKASGVSDDSVRELELAGWKPCGEGFHPICR